MGNKELSETLEEIDFDMIVPKNETSKTYWVSTRCINAMEDFCYFGIYCVESGAFGAYGIDGSNTFANHNLCALFPVVSLDVEHIKKDGGSGFKVE